MELSVTSPDGTNSSVVLTSANGNAVTSIVAGGASVSLSMGLSGYTSFDMIGVDELAAVGTMAKLGQARISGGLAIGDVTLDPLTGVLLMKERTAATGATPADTAQIWVQDVAGVQKFYIKFANGVQREIATA
jgi:hypothetical protein